MSDLDLDALRKLADSATVGRCTDYSFFERLKRAALALCDEVERLRRALTRAQTTTAIGDCALYAETPARVALEPFPLDAASVPPIPARTWSLGPGASMRGWRPFDGVEFAGSYILAIELSGRATFEMCLRNLRLRISSDADGALERLTKERDDARDLANRLLSSRPGGPVDGTAREELLGEAFEVVARWRAEKAGGS